VPRTVLRRPLLLALYFVLLPSGGAAQSRPAPFETVDITLTALTDVGHGLFQRDWDPGLAAGVAFAFPFYRGLVETGLQYSHPEPRRDELPGFRSLFVYAGWGATERIGRRVHAHGGIRTGLFVMRFDGDTIPGFSRRESELGLALRAGLSYFLGPAWHLDASSSYQAVFTRPRIEEVFLSAGIGRRFQSPGWLRDFLD
jgi:hypothetical protein